MTLALYGKSRKRQGGLIFSAFMAIMVAAIGGVSLIGTALAHHATVTGVATCNTDGTWNVNWNVANSQSDKWMFINSVSSTAGTTALADFTPNPVGFSGSATGSTTNIPSNVATVTLTVNVEWYWFSDKHSGTNGTGKVGPQNHSNNPAINRPNCDGKVIIKKFVFDFQNTTTVFSADVKNSDTNAVLYDDTTFSEAGSPGNRTLTFAGASNLNLTVTENALAGWNLVGVAVMSGDKSCDFQTSFGVAGAASISDLDAGETYTVCFKNEEKPKRTLEICKQVISNGDATNNGGAFSIKVEGESDVNKTVYENETGSNNPDCSTREVVDGEAIDISEVTPGASAAWPGNASGWPKYNINGGSFTSLGSSITIVVGDDTCGLQQEEALTRGTEDLERTIENIVVAPDCRIIIQNKAIVPSVTMVKDDATLVSGKLRWKITLSSTYAVDTAVAVEDIGTANDSTPALVAGNETCVGTPTISSDVVTCVVPAGGSAYFHVETDLPVYTGADKCVEHTVTNTAYLLDVGATWQDHQADDPSDTGTYKVAATADASCITVEKSNGVANGNKVDWTVTFHNSGPAATVDMSDSYQDAGTGTNLDNPNLTCTLLGADAVEDCEVAVGANGNTTVTLHTDRPAAKCEDQTVSNTVDAYFNGTRLGTTGNGRTGTYTEKGDRSLCSTVIRLCKVWAFNVQGELSDGSTSFLFDVSDTSESEVVAISGVTEGNTTPTCVLVEVTNGLVTINEQVPAGFNTPTYETDITGVGNGTGAGVEFMVDGECYGTEQESLLADISGLVREILAVVAPATGEYACTITFFNTDNQNELPTGDLRVEKYLDINGDGDANDPGEGPIDEWVVEVSGPEVNGQFPLSNNGTWDWLGLNSGDIYTVSELQQPGYQVTNTTVDGVSKGAVLFTFTKIPHGGTTVIRFYNQPLGGTIVAHKVAVTRHNAGPETPAPNDDDGWTITVTSVQCGINISKQTDGNGNAVFTGLPLCTDYVVSENPVNASSPGFSPVSPVSVSGQTPNGQTITFKNRKDTQDPACTVNCVPTTSTPTTPTTPPTTVVPPTTTPVPPTPVSTVQGERTPGASATPIAPSTGGGIIGGATGGTNLVLIIAGLLALTSGLSFVALGRKSRR